MLILRDLSYYDVEPLAARLAEIVRGNPRIAANFPAVAKKYGSVETGKVAIVNNLSGDRYQSGLFRPFAVEIDGAVCGVASYSQQQLRGRITHRVWADGPMIAAWLCSARYRRERVGPELLGALGKEINQARLTGRAWTLVKAENRHVINVLSETGAFGGFDSTSVAHKFPHPDGVMERRYLFRAKLVMSD